MVIRANVHQAKTHFSELLERAHKREEVIVAKAGMPYGRLIPVVEDGGAPARNVSGADHRRRAGWDRVGRFSVGMRTYLLDTCALLWWMANAPELGRHNTPTPDGLVWRQLAFA
jgi:prevent-host-death family protein